MKDLDRLVSEAEAGEMSAIPTLEAYGRDLAENKGPVSPSNRQATTWKAMRYGESSKMQRPRIESAQTFPYT